MNSIFPEIKKQKTKAKRHNSNSMRIANLISIPRRVVFIDCVARTLHSAHRAFSLHIVIRLICVFECCRLLLHTFFLLRLLSLSVFSIRDFGHNVGTFYSRFATNVNFGFSALGPHGASTHMRLLAPMMML